MKNLILRCLAICIAMYAIGEWLGIFLAPALLAFCLCIMTADRDRQWMD